MKVNEVFKSIQGEGKRIGVPTFFIRTTGCNLNCEWCDTKYSFTKGKEYSVEELLELCEDEKEICLTGGEPMLQNDSVRLMKSLVAEKKNVVLETNGSVDLSKVPKKVLISMDIKCPSSKMEKKMLFENIALLKEKDQLKFIIADDRDFDYAMKIVKKYDPKCECIFSPVGGMDMKPLVEKILESGKQIRVLPQLHKIIWGNRKGV